MNLNRLFLIGLCALLPGTSCKGSSKSSQTDRKPSTMVASTGPRSAAEAKSGPGLPELRPHERSGIATCDLYLRFMKCLGARVPDKFVSRAAGLIQAGVRGYKRRTQVDPMLQEQLSSTCHGQLTQMRDRWQGRTEVQECLDAVQTIPPP
jgi:hypothetical protein